MAVDHRLSEEHVVIHHLLDDGPGPGPFRQRLHGDGQLSG